MSLEEAIALGLAVARRTAPAATVRTVDASNGQTPERNGALLRRFVGLR
jgi:hypothetical protein